MREVERPTDRSTEDVKETRIWLGLSASSLDVVKTVKYLVIAVELEGATVKLIASALRHIVDDGTLVATVLGREVISDNLNFLNLILIVNEQGWPGNAQVIVVRAVNLEIVRAGTIAIDRKAGAVRVDAAAVVRNHAGREQRQRIETTARRVGGEVFDLARLDGRRELRLVALDDLFRVGDDGHRLGDVARFELDLERVDDTSFNLHMSVDRALEACGLSSHGVCAGLQ